MTKQSWRGDKYLQRCPFILTMALPHFIQCKWKDQQYQRQVLYRSWHPPSRLCMIPSIYTGTFGPMTVESMSIPRHRYPLWQCNTFLLCVIDRGSSLMIYWFKQHIIRAINSISNWIITYSESCVRSRLKQNILTVTRK